MTANINCAMVIETKSSNQYICHQPLINGTLFFIRRRFAPISIFSVPSLVLEDDPQAVTHVLCHPKSQLRQQILDEFISHTVGEYWGYVAVCFSCQPIISNSGVDSVPRAQYLCYLCSQPSSLESSTQTSSIVAELLGWCFF